MPKTPAAVIYLYTAANPKDCKVKLDTRVRNKEELVENLFYKLRLWSYFIIKKVSNLINWVVTRMSEEPKEEEFFNRKPESIKKLSERWLHLCGY